MVEQEKREGMLSPYRVLDLTDEKGFLCGKLLGDLGADVIKIERPGGDPARSIGPFYHDEVDPEKSLYWWAFNTSKRGITLDIETTDGQDIFKKLAMTADFVIESFPPGYMDKLGLGYSALEKLNPRIVLVSITNFGQTGPYKDFKASDLVAWAMGGYMHPWGDADRPPVRISHHFQAYLHAGGEAAIGAMIALHQRATMGEGQHVDVSIHSSVSRIAYGFAMMWDMMKIIPHRGGLLQNIHITRMWPCKDGYVLWFFFGGGMAHYNPPFVKWMEEEGMANDFIREFDWSTFDLTTITQEVLDRLEQPTRQFFMAHTKAELLEGSVKYDVILFPVSTVADILESTQLATREFWVELEHPELNAFITYPGAFAHASDAPPRVSCRAPKIGEHNQEIYEQWLGISKEELLALRQTKVI